MTYLPDVNVWIALTVKDHILHSSAKRWVDSIENEALAFCRVTQMGFLRLLTNTHVMGSDVFDAKEAWSLWEQLRQDARIVFALEPPAIEHRWQKLTAAHTSGSNFWTDTYLSAFAQASEHTLVTFDQGFRKRSKLLSVKLLTADGH